MRISKTVIVLSTALCSSPALAQEAEEPPPDEGEAAEASPAPADEPDPPAASVSVAASADTSNKAVAVENEAPASGGANLSQRGAEVANPDEWRFEYHGYFRAPLRLGIGKRDNPAEGQSSTTLHFPLIPDGQYLSWQFTSHNRSDWAEMFFSMGNQYAKGVLAIQGFNFTDSAWNFTTAQFGIGQGWIEVNSDLGYENVDFWAKVGSFWTRYGRAGRWDAGEYDTYLFGRTHALGEAFHFGFELNPDYTLWVEDGIGAKRPDPSIYNRARLTMLHHAHAGLDMFGGEIQLAAHYLTAWSQEELRINQNTDQNRVAADPATGNATATSVDLQPDGRLTVLGVDGRFDLAAAGYLYAGVAHVIAKDAVTVGAAIETIHSFGGGEFNLGITDNYLESPECDHSVTAACSGGNGSVTTLLGQYELNFSNLIEFGGGQDLRWKLYGMYNKIASDDQIQDGTSKLKFGTDLEFLFTSWLSAGFRFDRLQPNSRIPEESFMILSPRLTFRTDWATREQLSIQYSRYVYNQRVCDIGNPTAALFADAAAYGATTADGTPGRVFCVQPPTSVTSPDSYGANIENISDPDITRAAPITPSGRPDVNVIKVEASMWW